MTANVPVISNTAIGYRPDINGLRAIAILSVVTFHAFPDVLAGGFIGVDVFFVISGFLISTIIFRGLRRGDFSFLEFYGRRVSRIFPSLLAMLLVSFTFGWFALNDEEFKHLGKHIAGSAGFISNFVLWKESGYFDNYAVSKPLLHLWSLGIEEQFYIIWPLLLWLAWKRRVSHLSIICILLAISFALNIGQAALDSTAAFYAPHTRFWELLAGALLAHATEYPDNIFSRTRQRFSLISDNHLSIAGAALIGIGVIFITKDLLYPSWWALFPTMGSLLLIAAGSQSWLNRKILSNPMLVWFGLISYPLYLWHWPLLSFARIYSMESTELPLTIRIAVVAVSIILAWFSYAVIEKPFRLAKHGNSRSMPKTNLLLLVLLATIGLAGYQFYCWDGFIYRNESLLRTVRNEGDIGHRIFHEYMAERFFLCTPTSIQKDALSWDDRIVRCHQSGRDSAPTIVIIGDSHAEHLFIGLAESLPRKNIVYYSKSPYPYIREKAYEKIYHYVTGSPSTEIVVISAFWGFDVDLNALNETVRELIDAGKQVYIAEDVPKFSFFPQRCKYSRWARLDNCIEDSQYDIQRYQSYSQKLQLIIRQNPQAKLLKVFGYFCDRNYCEMASDGLLLYRDRNHLNVNGSRYLGSTIVAAYPELAH